MRSVPFRWRTGGIPALLAVLALAGCLRNPEAELAAEQQLSDLTVLLQEMRQGQAALQAQVDSLRQVVVAHDTLVRRLADYAGVPR